jgi:hypothetical protein
LRLLLDECSGAHTLVEGLNAAGHDVERSVDVLGSAAVDEAVLAYATESDRVLVTMNCDDFLALASDGRRHAGLLLHYRRANGGLTYDQIVTAVGNIASAFPTIGGMAISLNQWAWAPR